MKKIYLLFFLQILSYQIMAGSISGEISYSGSFTATIYVALFTDPELNTDPSYVTTFGSPGSYTISDIADGTYYVVSVMTDNLEEMLFTDPYGFWGTTDGLIPVVISGNNDVTGINITLVDGTEENPNPFADYYTAPTTILQLPVETEMGNNPSMVYDGSSILLYKHDFQNLGNARIFSINPETGELLNTYYLTLESSPNKISWIDKMVYRNGVLWASGGYGNPDGSGYKPGVFKIDIASSTSSNQLPFSNDFKEARGLACDGVNFFIGNNDSTGLGGIVKFNPDQISEVPSALFINLSDEIRDLSFGNNFLWVGIDRINQFNAVTGEYIANLPLPGSAAELFFDNKFWSYDETHNTIRVYDLSAVSVDNEDIISVHDNFTLSQNYPNPFNPATKISYTLSQPSTVELRVFNTLGQEIAKLVNEEKPAGSYEIVFDASRLSSGVYFYQLKSGNFIETKRMLLLK